MVYLIDIVFRKINNLGFCLFKKVERNASDPVCFVLGIYADLYYTIDGKECVLKCRGRALALVTEEKKIRFTVRRGHKIIREEQEFLDYEDYTDLNFGQMKEVAQLFFYTISTNYSLQAYIAMSFNMLCHSWRKWRFVTYAKIIQLFETRVRKLNKNQEFENFRIILLWRPAKRS